MNLDSLRSEDGSNRYPSQQASLRPNPLNQQANKEGGARVHLQSHANQSAIASPTRSNATTSTISLKLIFLRPTSSIRMTSPRLLAPIACRIAIMTTVTAVMMIDQKARGPGNFINADQITPYAADQTFCLKLSHALLFF